MRSGKNMGIFGSTGRKNPILSPGEAVNGYKVVTFLGNGAFGNVYKVETKEKTFALKRIDKSAQGPFAVWNEIETLKKAKDDNVVMYIESFIDTVTYNIVLEYCEHGSIDEFLRNFGHNTNEKKRMGFVQDIANGVAHLHTGNIIIAHRDLKPANILIDSKCVAKIADFGLAKVFNSPAIRQKLYMHTEAGTVPYMAPEVLNGDQYNIQADIFSMGLIFCSILDDDLKNSVETIGIGHQMNIEPGYKFNLQSKIRDSMIKLINRMLKKDYKDRPTANDIKTQLKLLCELLFL